MQRQSTSRKDVFWLSGEIKSPPFSDLARQEAGRLIGLLQDGETIGMPHARPRPAIGRRCLELRVVDKNATWRIVCRTDPDVVVIAAVFEKKTQSTPKQEIENSKARLAAFDRVRNGGKR